MKLWELFKGKDYHIEPTLRRIEDSLDYLGKPQESFPAILVGGTNGKGSTCAFLERILREHGYKTGWFVSPHLVSENERWRVNGALMPEDLLSDYVKEFKGIFARFNLTYFESATLIAFAYFKDMEVDVAVIEVGMGGRWDATKTCKAVVVGITNVERDHIRWLGRDIESIAEDKLHLYREGIPLVLGSARYPLYTKALEMGLRNLSVAGEDYTYKGALKDGRDTLKDYSSGDFNLEEAKLSLLGKWQVDNSAMAITLARYFATLEDRKTKSALADTRWEGRMEILRDNPTLMVDGSHNPYAVGKVVKEVLRRFPSMRVVFTGLLEKEWALSMELIRRYTDTIYLVQVNHYRGEPVANMVRRAKELNFKNIKVLEAPFEVWHSEEELFAVGSLYLVGEIKEASTSSVI